VRRRRCEGAPTTRRPRSQELAVDSPPARSSERSFPAHRRRKDARKTYTQEEHDNAKAAIAQQLAAYKQLANAIDSSDPGVEAALEAIEPLLFNNMTLVLDRYFVHRLRMVTGKDGNPLNEVELMTESLMNNDGVLRGNNVIKLVPEETVLKLEIGDRIRLTAAQFERLSKAFLAQIQAKFL
jgi:hypothetical protein